MENKNQQIAYSFRMLPEIKKEAQILASKNQRSLNWQLNQLVLMGLKTIALEKNASS